MGVNPGERSSSVDSEHQYHRHRARTEPSLAVRGPLSRVEGGGRRSGPTPKLAGRGLRQTVDRGTSCGWLTSRWRWLHGRRSDLGMVASASAAALRAARAGRRLLLLSPSRPPSPGHPERARPALVSRARVASARARGARFGGGGRGPRRAPAADTPSGIRASMPRRPSGFEIRAFTVVVPPSSGSCTPVDEHRECSGRRRRPRITAPPNAPPLNGRPTYRSGEGA